MIIKQVRVLISPKSKREVYTCISNYQVIIKIEYRYMYHIPEAAALIVFYLKKQWIFVPFSGVIKYIQKLIILYKLNGIVFDLQDYIF